MPFTILANIEMNYVFGPGDDGMRKRVLAMMSFMRLKEVKQPNMGRVQLNIQAFIEEVRQNKGKVLFDSDGYRLFVEKETGSNEHEEVEQIRRPKVCPHPQVADRNGGTFGGRSCGDRTQSGHYGRGRGNGRQGQERFGHGGGGDRRSFHESENVGSEGHYGPSPPGQKRDRSSSPQDSRSDFRRSSRGRGFGGDGYQDRRGRGRGGYRGRGRGGRGGFDRRQGNEGSNRSSLDWEAPPAQSLQWEAPPQKNLQWEAPPPPPQQNLRWEAPPGTEPHQGNPESSHSSRGYNL